MDILKRILELAKNNVHFIILAIIVAFAIWLRLPTANTQIILDYDPWFWFRHAQEILSNHLLPLRWDELSFFPPGRPVDYQLGWSYALAFSYLITKVFLPTISLMKTSTYFIAVFAGLCAIPAYFVGRMVTNRWGGLITAFFATVTPTFISVSMAGYPDSDAVDVFYTFLALFATLYAIRHFNGVRNWRSWIGIGFAILSYWLFAFNWNSSWYIYFILVLAVPIFIVAVVLEEFISKKGFGNPVQLMASKIKEARTLIVVLGIIGILGLLLTSATEGWPFNTIPLNLQMIQGLDILRASLLYKGLFIIFCMALGGIAGYAFRNIKTGILGVILGLAVAIYVSLSVTGHPLLVNISVAELQPLDLRNNFVDSTLQVMSRVGFASQLSNPLTWTNPMIWAVAGLLGVVVYKVYKKSKITLVEYFTLIWMIISFWLISSGIRFSLLFSLALATSAGLVVGNLVEILKNRNIVFGATFIGFIIFSLVVSGAYNIQISQQSSGMEVDANWMAALNWLKDNANKDALVTTWWDPGHIITGYTGLRVHADGAHCGDSCVPYNHDVRIQDMGRIFATGDENESVSILQKYQQLTPAQCQEVKDKYGSIVPSDACDKVPEMYLIASSDLIGKYYWLSYFGEKQGTNYYQLQFSGMDQSGLPTYGGIITLLQQNSQIMGVLNIPAQGIRNMVVKEIVYFDSGGQKRFDYSNMTNTIDGMLWVDPSFRMVIYMPPVIRDSVFTKLFFFDGQGLSRFQQVFGNSEVKIYKVLF